MTRIEAKQKGLKTYEGNPCRKGHNGLRLTASNHCFICKTTNDRQYEKDNPEVVRARSERYRTENKEKHRAAVDRWHAANPEKRKAISARWSKNNPAKLKEYNGVNRAIRSHGLKMLTKEQRKEMARIYKECPIGYHVDHIHPLNGKISCGLHVPWNLQYLTVSENIKKSNKLLEEYLPLLG